MSQTRNLHVEQSAYRAAAVAMRAIACGESPLPVGVRPSVNGKPSLLFERSPGLDSVVMGWKESDLYAYASLASAMAAWQRGDESQLLGFVSSSDMTSRVCRLYDALRDSMVEVGS